MNANFFDKYSIEEISKRTKISPISLRFIKNKEYDKIPKVKFLGFIKIIEREFNEDLSYLIQEYEENIKPKKESPKEKPPQKNILKKEKNNIIYILSTILLILTGSIIYLKSIQNTLKAQTTKKEILETNATQEVLKQALAIKVEEKEKPILEEKEKNTSTSIKTPKKAPIPSKIVIIPNEKVWFRALNLDNNKTIEYLTSNPKTLPGSSYLIKFGHGNITIAYGNTTITPNTKKIVRIYFQDGKYKYVKKGFKP